MEGPILRLTADDVCRALEQIDPIELMAALPFGQAWQEQPPCGRFLPTREPAGEVELEDLCSGVRCLLPESSLRTVRDTVLVALAAGRLLASGPATVGLLASVEAAQVYLVMMARHRSDVGHVALSPPVGRTDTVDIRVLELLDQAGINLVVTADRDDAVRGANLVIAAGPGHDQLSPGQLARGALLVNATGTDLPDDLVDGVDEIYVDDLGLLEENQHRHFVRVHMGSRSPARPESRLEHDGWHRPTSAWRSLRHIEADLGQLLNGEHPGRTHQDNILLVELLGTRALDVALTCRLQQTALEHGFGNWLPR
jgi:hypothetical protein